MIRAYKEGPPVKRQGCKRRCNMSLVQSIVKRNHPVAPVFFTWEVLSNFFVELHGCLRQAVMGADALCVCLKSIETAGRPQGMVVEVIKQCSKQFWTTVGPLVPNCCTYRLSFLPLCSRVSAEEARAPGTPLSSKYLRLRASWA